MSHSQLAVVQRDRIEIVLIEAHILAYTMRKLRV